MHAPCHPALTSFRYVNPPLKESTRENSKEGKRVSQDGGRCKPGGRDAQEVIRCKFLRIVLLSAVNFITSASNQPKCDLGHFNSGVVPSLSVY